MQMLIYTVTASLITRNLNYSSQAVRRASIAFPERGFSKNQTLGCDTRPAEQGKSSREPNRLVKLLRLEARTCPPGLVYGRKQRARPSPL